ncbi:MAG: methyltransferase domain-containing protein [Gammaproteobacteria bacterium]|jgi:ubiquinone/menaquinone biosynthesis C-methylase UbiE
MTERPAPGITDNERDASWDAYWREGQFHSLADAYHGNYGGRIRAFWETVFARQPAGAAVVDLGTGNGAIPLIAREVSEAHGLKLEIHGIDRADIDPPAALATNRQVDFSGIRFHPRTPAEATGFPADTVRLVTAQYAFEYTDTDATVAELARILQPGGQLAFIMHHSDSVILRTTREELDHARLVFEEVALFDKAAALLELMAAATTPAAREALQRDPKAQRRREALNEAAARISARIESAGNPLFLQTALGMVSDVFQRATGLAPDRIRGELDSAAQRLGANLGRLRDLVRAQVGRERRAAIESALGAAGFAEIHIEPMTDRPPRGAEALIGWRLEARR